MKQKKRYICEQCGYTTSSWLGKCPECLNWNTFIEEFIETPPKQLNDSKNILLKISDIEILPHETLKFACDELNIFFGEGLALGAIYLLAGEPGIGKSTFLLLLLKQMQSNEKAIYFSGEETPSQIKNRMIRVELSRENLYISNITNVETIIKEIKNTKPSIVFIDSIQTIYSDKIDSGRGTVSQIRKCTELLSQCAKDMYIPIIIIGHVTKTGEIAGPKIMEHMVDVVIYFETDTRQEFQILRIIKNRYGSTDEILFLEMTNKGLKIINDPTNVFVLDSTEDAFLGKCKSVIREGRRLLVIDVEALVVPSIYAYPKRFSEGVDVSRINRITAIINKYVNENLSNYDIYFNITGGIKTKDPAIDLAIAMAIYSSKNKKYIYKTQGFIGELSLTGQIKNVKKSFVRIKELQKYGVKNILCNIKNDSNLSNDLTITQTSSIEEAIKLIFP